VQNGGKVVGGHGAAGLVDDLSLSSYKNNFFVVINLTELKKKLNWLGFFPGWGSILRSICFQELYP